jgi:hypothetical protein
MVCTSVGMWRREDVQTVQDVLKSGLFVRVVLMSVTMNVVRFNPI